MENRKTLQGVKVVDLSTFVAAPVCTRMLADMGADVVKIEGFGGDPWRVTGKGLTFTGDEENPVFDIYNAGKKSIRLNIKHEAGMNVLMMLLEDADIFITNIRMMSLKKQGLDYETLSSKFPRLIYGTITGYGEKGPDANAPGFDNIAFWTRSGFLMDMSVKAAGSYPVYSPMGAGDTFAGTTLLSGVLAALYQREKTGRGDLVTTSLLNAGLWMCASMIVQAQEKYSAKWPKERNDALPLATSYKCADGEWLGITVLDHDRYRETIFEILGVAEKMAPLRITTQEEMQENSNVVIPILEQAFLKKTAAEWHELFQNADVVCGILNHMRDAVKDEQAIANEYVQEYVCHNGEVCMMPCPPARLGSQPVPKSKTAPLPGENTRQVLEGLGYTENEIDSLIATGAVQ